MSIPRSPSEEWFQRRHREALDDMRAKEIVAHAMFAPADEGRDQACEALRLNRVELLHPQQIALRLDVSVEQVEWWLSEFLGMVFGYPQALAAVRARSEHTAPRHPETTRVFDRNNEIEAVVDIQRGHSTGDLLEFTSNWYVRIEGFAVRSRREVVVSGRIGEFLGAGHDRWWSIQLGWLTGQPPDAVTGPAILFPTESREEVLGALRAMDSHTDP